MASKDRQIRGLNGRGVRILAALSFALGSGCGEDAPVDAGELPEVVDASEDVLVDVNDAETGPEPDAQEPDAGEPDVASDAISPDAAPDAPPPEVEDTAIRCDPPLQVAPTHWARGRQALVPVPSGGTGAYRFRLVEAPSGGIVNPLTGEYVSGPTVGVTDRLAVDDTGCADVVMTAIHVVPDLAVAPAAIALTPGAIFAPSVSGGSGSWALSLDEAGTSGAELIAPPGSAPAEAGQIDLRRVRAGQTPGAEALLVTDLGTGEIVAVPIEVSRDAAPTFVPAWLFMPLGATFPVEHAGGSGVRSGRVLDANGPTLDEAEPAGLWLAEAHGASSLTESDVFVGTPLTQQVRTVGAVGVEAELTGAQLEFWSALGPGDIDGDGWPDVIVGSGEHNHGALHSGGVYIWAGSPEGIQPEPARVIPGSQRLAYLGSAMAAGDFDGDGLVDLAIGESRFNAHAPSVGRVQVFQGEAGAFFASSPSRVFLGVESFDLFGVGLAVCDFDGDGYDDLAVGADQATDRTFVPVTNRPGSVSIYRGGPSGLEAEPAQVLYGLVPAGAGWGLTANQRFGTVVAAGDFDGDGACDLAVGAWQRAGNAGTVWVYRGQDSGPTPVAAYPARVWEGTAGTRLGQALAAADLDGDGKDELIVGQPRWSTTATASHNHGAVRVQRGGDWLDGLATEPLSDADFDAHYLNPNQTAADTNDEYGFRVAAADVTGDGIPDLLIAGIVDELPCAGCVLNAGAISVLPGVDGELPLDAPVAGMTSIASSDRLGAAMAVIGPVDADGTVGVLGVAARDDTLGADVGLVRVYRPMAPADVLGAAAETLSLPSLEGGYLSGQALALVPDINGDGRPELLIGAPHGPGVNNAGIGVPLAGLATLHYGTAEGFAVEPTQVLTGFRRHSANDRWGFDVAGLTDFDGDGRADLAIAASTENKATSYGGGISAESACLVSESNTGAVAVFSGRPDGTFDSEPSLMHFGPHADGWVQVIVTLDFDGDGLSDLALGSARWDRPGTGASDDAGGVEIVLGRPRAHPSNTAIVCTPDHRLFGFEATADAGTSLASLGDIDGDGCDDLAVGHGRSNALAARGGAVEILFGAGPACATEAVRHVFIGGPQVLDNLGVSLHAADVDGDGLRELVIGGPRHRVDGVEVGGAWIVGGRALAALAEVAAPRPVSGTPVAVPLYGQGGLGPTSLRGQALNEGLGIGVALLPGDPLSEVSTRPLLAVASREALTMGRPTPGLVRLHPLELRAEGTIIAPRPVAAVAGEEHGALARSARLEATAAGSGHGRRLLIGASESSLIRPFSGGVIVVDLDGDAAGGAR